MPSVALFLLALRERDATSQKTPAASGAATDGDAPRVERIPPTEPLWGKTSSSTPEEADPPANARFCNVSLG
jgi:hypothetical protein